MYQRVPEINILWICTDQQRADTIHALGNPHIRTPHIDAMVANGTVTRAAAKASCTPVEPFSPAVTAPRCRQNGQAMPPQERLISRYWLMPDTPAGSPATTFMTCANGVVEKRIDDGYEVFHWSHHPQPDWPENAYTQWLTEQGTSREELYDGPATPYIKHGIPAV